MASLREVISNAVEAVRPRDWTDHVATLEKRQAAAIAQRTAVESELQRVAADAFAAPDDRDVIARRDDLAGELAATNIEADTVSRALAGARARLADAQSAARQDAATAKRQRVTGILDAIRLEADKSEAAIEVLATSGERIAALRDELAQVSGGEAAILIQPRTLGVVISHRLAASFGLGSCPAFQSDKTPRLADHLPATDYVLSVAGLGPV